MKFPDGTKVAAQDVQKVKLIARSMQNKSIFYKNMKERMEELTIPQLLQCNLGQEVPQIEPQSKQN